MVHLNSIKAYGGIPLTQRQVEVVAAFQELGKATDQQVADYLLYAINRVTGRVKELTDKGVLREAGTIRGRLGKDVRVSELVPLYYQESLFEM